MVRDQQPSTSRGQALTMFDGPKTVNCTEQKFVDGEILETHLRAKQFKTENGKIAVIFTDAIYTGQSYNSNSRQRYAAGVGLIQSD